MATALTDEECLTLMGGLMLEGIEFGRRSDGKFEAWIPDKQLWNADDLPSLVSFILQTRSTEKERA